MTCINSKFPWKKCVFKFIYNSFYKPKTLCVPVLKIIYFKSDRECIFIWEIFRESKPGLTCPLARSWLGRDFFNPYEKFSWSKSYLEHSKILVKTFSALDGIVSLNCTVPNNAVKVTVTNKNLCKYKIYIWDKLKGKGCKKCVSEL